MPDQLNKQTLINLLIDSPLREPIKINLIDIVNNTSDPDLPKIFPTIVKELEIFQKATERRMKLADETIAKLGGTSSAPSTEPSSAPTPTPAPSLPPSEPTPTPQPTPAPIAPTPTLPTEPASTTTPNLPPISFPPLSVPPLDLPPLPQVPTPSTPTPEPVAPPAPATPAPLPPLQPMGNANVTSSDEDALAEIQKELESLKSGIAADANPTPAPAQ